MTITSREYRGEADYQRVRELLIESYTITQRMHNWGLDRWDFFRFSGRVFDEMANSRGWEKDVHLWEDGFGKLVGVVNPEDRGTVFVQIHPDHRCLEDEMFDWAERRHQASRPADADRWPLSTSVYDYDRERAALLTQRGYRNLGLGGYKRRCALERPIPDAPLPAGYSIRNIRGKDQRDLAKWAAVDNQAFNITKHTAETVQVRLRAPTYRQDLDLVAVAPDGTFASFCIVWFDEVNRYGAFEPVGTHPAHRKRGLAKAAMCEGLRRLKALGGTMAYVGCGTDVAANRLYESVGFTDFYRDYPWQKDF